MFGWYYYHVEARAFESLVRDRLRVIGSTPISVALSAGLPRDAVRSVLRGHPPNLVRAAEICEALGLRLHIGLPDDTSRVNEPLQIAELYEVLTQVEASRSALLEILVRLPASSGVIEFPVTTQLSGVQRLAVPVRELQSAAGGGVMDLDETVTGDVYFRAQWLKKHGLNPDRCSVIGVTGESMEPTLVDGCSILLDHDRRQLRAGGIFVVRTGDGLVVKRAGRGRDGGWQLCSDNPDWTPVPWSDDADIVGQVMWTARTLI